MLYSMQARQWLRDELADNYVGGDLDREAFEQEVETVFEREAER